MGVRSWDFLTDGVINKINFFNEFPVELILYVDEHEPLPESVREEILRITEHRFPLGRFKFVCKRHEQTHRRWNEIIYLEALKLATGNYVAHFDGDCAVFAHPDLRDSIVEYHVRLLDSALIKFVCQPSTMGFLEHGMTWASTRFFFCRRESLNLSEIEKCIVDESYRAEKYGHVPALEHVLGAIGGTGSVFYPRANWDEYMIFSWSRYHRGLLAKLNTMSYNDVRDYILGCGIHGPNDVISKPI